MKKILILALAIVMCASVGFAQAPGGEIGLFSDSPGYSDCNLVPAAPYADTHVYIVHTLVPTANSSQWKLVTNIAGAPLNEGAADFQSNLYLGAIHTGITVTYVGCKNLPYLLAVVPYFYYGNTTTDPTTYACQFSMSIEPDPGAETGEVEAVSCGLVKQIAVGGMLTIWGDPEACPCQLVATEETNWSRIKALYR